MCYFICNCRLCLKLYTFGLHAVAILFKVLANLLKLAFFIASALSCQSNAKSGSALTSYKLG
jgi:hypothetical protein